MGLAADDRCSRRRPLSHSYGFSSLLLPALVRGSPLVFAEERSPFAPLAAARDARRDLLPDRAGLARRARAPRRAAAAGRRRVRLVIARRRAAAARDRARASASATAGRCTSSTAPASAAASPTTAHGDAAERGTVGTPVDGRRDRARRGERPLRGALGGGRRAVPARARAELAGGRFLHRRPRARARRGELRLLGRADDLVIVRGKNVNPREVEAVLRDLAGVEDVASSASTARGPAHRAARGRRAARAAARRARRRGALPRQRLAEHKVPRSVVFVAELPRTARGKLDRGRWPIRRSS